MYSSTKLLIVILDFIGMDNLIEYCTPGVQFIIWIALTIFILFAIYYGFTKKRYKILENVNGNKSALFCWLIGLIGVVLIFIYAAFDAIDSKISVIIKSFFWILVGIGWLASTYFYKKFDVNKMIEQWRQESNNLHGVKKAIYDSGIEQAKIYNNKFVNYFVIVVGILFGIISIFSGVVIFLGVIFGFNVPDL